MANRRKDKLRELILKYRRESDLTMKEIAEKVGLPDRQWVYYYLSSAKKDNKTND